MAKVQTVDTVSINELRKIIPLIATEITPVIQSEPGCGKTSLLAMIAEDNGDQRQNGDYKDGCRRNDQLKQETGLRSWTTHF